jgi:hypothetical protein
MKTEQKLIAAGALLVALLGGYYLVRQGKEKDAQAHTVKSAKDLPKIAVEKDKADKITKLAIKSKEHGEVVLEKKADKWRVTKPVDAPAAQGSIDGVLNALKEIKLTKVINEKADDKVLERNELDEKSATHVQAFAGEEKLFDVSFGKSGSGGNATKLSGNPTVFAASGYSAFTFAKETKSWRDTQILKFEDGNVIALEVENKKGKFSFTKNGDKWAGSFYPRDEKKGDLAEKAAKWERFDEAKVKDMLVAYKSLMATDFAKDKADTGIDKAVEEGGVIRVKFKDGNGDFTVKVGKKQEGDNRYLAKDGGDGTVFVVTNWSTDWATADLEKFSKPEEKKDDKKDDKKDKKDDKKDKGKDDGHGDEGHDH